MSQSSHRDVEIVFTETVEEAAAIVILDVRRREGRIVVPVVAEWGPHYAALARGRRVFMATPNDWPGDKTAKKWGEDAWRAGALDVLRERSPGSRTWCEALDNGRTHISTVAPSRQSDARKGRVMRNVRR